ncbi:hypothetical protein M407DRAFT_23218 [Tulasnella calospora MUT 4182]|uniref:F-box domain-containing protein n=1 Tax=Tulasnella calospora MUT 4182 TaxID=1051891 RepID=A0A0C3QLK5_9AGAM|nr:hypothetical protein M407DRAFT_23218 [Tulasnella calospora MUT 4182]
MKKSIDTKTDSSSGGLPWPPVAIASTTWHTNSPFFRDLLSDTQRLSKFMNLEGLGDRMKELSECSDDCSCKTVSDEDSESEDSEAREGLGGNYCPAGMMKLENREFVVLEQWIPKMNEAVERLVEIRDRMVAQASLSRRNLEERLALLNGEASRRILKKFPHGVDMPLMNNSPLCSDDDESISNGEAGPADDREDVTGLGSISPQTETRGLQIGNPSQSLPAEILYEVILEAQALDPHIHLNLSYVNQYFRNLVNTSPLLWSKVDFWYPLSVTSLYLERSAGASLDVTADRGCQQSRSQKIRAMEDTKISAFYELLRPHRHRIRRLKMQASSPLPLEAEIENGDQHSSEPGGRLESFLWSPMLSRHKEPSGVAVVRTMQSITPLPHLPFAETFDPGDPAVGPPNNQERFIINAIPRKPGPSGRAPYRNRFRNLGFTRRGSPVAQIAFDNSKFSARHTKPLSGYRLSKP